jgi:class 3 adenylate cyclase
MHDVELPETRYALSGEINIAYQTIGYGPIDLILVPGIFSHVEFMHELPGYTATLRRLATFARVVTFDKRGQGLSDRISGAPSLEQRMDDVRAVMDEIGSQRAVLFGFSEGCAMSVLFAATYPERVSQVVLVGGFACAADRLSEDAWIARRDFLVKNWGAGEIIKTVVPSDASNPAAVAQFAKFERLSSSPGALKTILSLNRQVDVSSILPSLRTPTLVIHRATDAQVPAVMGRKMAAAIPGARYIEYDGGDHAFWTGDVDTLVSDVEEFVTGHRPIDIGEFDRVLATVLFTDIVDSTRTAAGLGDKNWHRLLDLHDDLAHKIVADHRGTLVKTTGDGVLARFDGPGRAVRCALSFSAAAGQIGLPLRAGVHTGEIELRGSDVGGIAVHAAARVMAHAASGEVLVSRVVTDLVAGAGLSFAERGSHELKGIPGRWDLFAAVLQGSAAT